MPTWIQKALPQFKDFEGEALSSVENWILCKSKEWLPDLTIEDLNSKMFKVWLPWPKIDSLVISFGHIILGFLT